jgi:beta-mannanase
MREAPMLGISTGGGEGGGAETITSGQIAHGAGDALLVALNQAIAAWGKPIYVRPLAEMNGHWNAYCAFNRDGSARSADHSTAAFRQAFARIYLVVHGGSRVNQRLRRLKLPPVSATLAPNPDVRVIWNPQGYGSPDLPANSAASYYPGDAYVDVVGDDLYDIRGKAEWAAAAALYGAHPGKPFSFPEWGLWGIDDPSFVTQMAAFVRTHVRTGLIGYYSGRPGSIFDLSTKARSLAAYRQAISPLGR